MSRGLESVLRWVALVIGRGAQIVSAESLRSGGSPWRVRVETSGEIVEAILKAAPLGQREELATEAAALFLAEQHGLPTPRLIAVDLTGEAAGALAVLMTVLPGTSDVPLEADPARLQAVGAAAAAVHGIPIEPTEDLPLRTRHMPWIDYAEMRRDGIEVASTPLLDEADRLIQSLAAPEEATVFVHGDLWQGNTMWTGDAYVGMIDWEAAGAGGYGIDLGSLRWDAALLFGFDAAAEVLAGWERASGRRAENVPYWDVVAALNTPADMSAYEESMSSAGRPDLKGRALTERRDAFLMAALERLGED
ncbi:MAG TPA: aminoglycoside phosphotransferase family protein [Acidimicrobiales bacterium]|nr:aminoglycoside phosphotransferase family protein [Acidimicrobiales bacterium]